MIEGHLRRDVLGRWEIVGSERSETLTAGDICEIQINEHWIETRIEYSHDLGCYYAVVPGITLKEGLGARQLANKGAVARLKSERAGLGCGGP
jgi:hypothetical protein